MPLGWPEMLLIAVVIMVLFGSKKMPDAARSLGRSLRIFKSETKGLIGDDKNEAAPEKPASQQPQAQAQIPPVQEDSATLNGVPLTQDQQARKS